MNPEPFVQPEPEAEPDPTEELVGDHSEEEEKDNKNYLVKTPWYCDSLTGEGFPEITPAGVEMTAAERQLAYEAAKQAGFTLKSKEV